MFNFDPGKIKLERYNEALSNWTKKPKINWVDMLQQY